MQLRIAISALALACLAGLASGQPTRKPDVPPDGSDERYEIDEARWREVYDAAGRPAMMVLAGLASARRAGDGVGSSLLSIDAEGDSFVLKSEIERALLENPDAEVVNLDALSDLERRDAALLLESRERDAIDLLSTALDAPLVLVARLQPGAREGARYRVTFEAIDAPRGRTLSTIAFDWNGGADTLEIKRYARLLVNDFLDNYERRVGAPGRGLPFTVRVLGLDTRDLQAFARDAGDIPGVREVRSVQRQAGRRQSVAELRLRYEGDPLDLTAGLLDAGPLDLALESLDMGAGAITLRAEGERHMGSSWRIRASDSNVPLWDDLAPVLRERSIVAGSPRVALLLGRGLSPWELDIPVFRSQLGALGGDTSIVAADRGGSNVFITIADEIHDSDSGERCWGGVVPPRHRPSPTEGGLLESRRLEDLLLERLGPSGLGLEMVDAVTLRERALGAEPWPRFVYRDAELIELVRSTGLADIAAFGVGRLERDRDVSILRYTIRAVELETGRVLSVATAAAEVDADADPEEVHEILGELADEAALRLGAGLADAWAP